MRVATMACPAGDLLLTDREDPCAGKLRVDLPDEHDHFARDVFPRIEIPFLGFSTAMAIVAIHVERVAKLAHERVRTVHVRLWRQQL